MSASAYPYSQGDRLEDRNTYFYSEFRGMPFLEAWQASRDAALAALPPARPLQPRAASIAYAGPAHDTAELLSVLIAQAEPCSLLDRLLQRFEVSKRLYRRYDADFKAIRDSGYDDLELYLQFAALCLRCQGGPAAMRFLNALLKTLDSLMSARARLGNEQGAQLAWLIGEERAWVRRIAEGVGVELAP